MPVSQNIQIPDALFEKLIVFFEYIEISEQNFPSLFDCRGMLSELRKKQHNINLRSAFTKIKQAADAEQKRAAYTDYVRLKRKGREFVDGN